MLSGRVLVEGGMQEVMAVMKLVVNLKPGLTLVPFPSWHSSCFVPNPTHVFQRRCLS